MADSVDALIVVGGQNSGNTQRLAEIARQAGKPTYHIEAESELDLKALSSARFIGIAAGASTPNWIIKRVYRTLETLPSAKRQSWYRFIFTIQRALLLTNIYVSIGAGCLCYACTKLLGITDYFPHVLISMLYVQSMHIFNNLTGTKADRYNDPDYAIGLVPFLILLAMSIMGLSYNLTLVPKRFARLRYRRIRDIPGSKTVLIAMAWGIVTSVLPSLSVSKSIPLSTALVLSWSLSLVFVRSAFFDILDMQGDRIVGKETIPIMLGEERALRLLKSLLIINFGILLLSSAFHLISSLGFAVTLCPIFLFVALSAHERSYMLPGFRLEFLVETHFVLAGVITFVWSLF